MSDDTDARLKQRLTELETALAHQEQSLHALSDVVTDQWNAIDRLKSEIARLQATKADAEDEHGPNAQSEPPPPHY